MTELQQWIEILAPEFNRYLDLAAFLLGYMTLMQTKIDLIITGLDLRTTTVTEDVHGSVGQHGPEIIQHHGDRVCAAGTDGGVVDCPVLQFRKVQVDCPTGPG